MTKKKKYIAGILACLVIAAVLIGVWYQKNEGKGSRAVDGVYQRVVSADGSETSFHIAFDGGTMTYVQDMVVEGQSYTIDSGSYTVTDGIVQVYSETDDANSIAYVVDVLRQRPDSLWRRRHQPNHRAEQTRRPEKAPGRHHQRDPLSHHCKSLQVRGHLCQEHSAAVRGSQHHHESPVCGGGYPECADGALCAQLLLLGGAAGRRCEEAQSLQPFSFALTP